MNGSLSGGSDVSIGSARTVYSSPSLSSTVMPSSSSAPYSGELRVNDELGIPGMVSLFWKRTSAGTAPLPSRTRTCTPTGCGSARSRSVGPSTRLNVSWTGSGSLPLRATPGVMRSVMSCSSPGRATHMPSLQRSSPQSASTTQVFSCSWLAAGSSCGREAHPPSSPTRSPALERLAPLGSARLQRWEDRIISFHRLGPAPGYVRLPFDCFVVYE